MGRSAAHGVAMRSGGVSPAPAPCAASHDVVEIGAARRRTTGEGSAPRATRCLAASPGALTPERFGHRAPAWRRTQRVPRDRYRPAQDGPARAIPGTTNAMADLQHNALLSSVGASNAQVQLQPSQ